MTAATSSAGAFTDKTVTSWKNINWMKHKSLVSRLQKRIVKAVQQGRWNKVKVLQRLLVNSLSAKLLAIKRVTENRGKRTAGVDGVLWTTSKQKINAIEQLRKQGYHPQPLRRIYIPKNNNPQKKRPLSIPTMFPSQKRKMQDYLQIGMDTHTPSRTDSKPQESI